MNMTKLPRRVLLLLFLVGSLVLSVSLVQGIRELLAIENQVKQAEDVAQALEREKQTLASELTTVSSPDYQETEIRDNLLMAKPNETVVILPEIPPITPVAPPTKQASDFAQSPAEPMWKRWIEVLR